MRKKIGIALVLSGILLLTGCAGRVAADESNSGDDAVQIIDDNDEEENVNGGGYIDIGFGGEAIPVEDQIVGLIENQYPDLEVTAAVLERKAIHSGDTFKVSIAITNNGDETIQFVKGSGSNVVPDALIVVADGDGVQSVQPQSELGGIATMDFQTEVLEPGQTLNFEYYLEALAPGSYDISAYFLYAIANADEEFFLGEATGFAVSTFAIGIE
ncbi:MAG: hypothetical protein FWE25_00290 [Lachnospiraceae bacterium]|nr:hypothetical protein [Lachnospiraceae bacterium]